jgi:hypothetical protein
MVTLSLYINDLPLNISRSKLVLFADDTNLLVSEENLHTLQRKLLNVGSELQVWFSLNNLIVKTDKTSAISFHTTQDKNPIRPQVTLEYNVIPYNTTTKLLGVHINENFKWNDHIKQLKSKLSTTYYMITSLQKIANQYILQTVYFACFHTFEIWINIVGWGPRKQKRFLDTKKVIRVISKVG